MRTETYTAQENVRADVFLSEQTGLTRSAVKKLADAGNVTRGGIPLGETDENLMSMLRIGLFFAGEILNVDGVCGGYNLQWAFASAHAVSEGI